MLPGSNLARHRRCREPPEICHVSLPGEWCVGNSLPERHNVTMTEGWISAGNASAEWTECRYFRYKTPVCFICRCFSRIPWSNTNFTEVQDSNCIQIGAVAKWLRQRIANPSRAGSTPARPFHKTPGLLHSDPVFFCLYHLYAWHYSFEPTYIVPFDRMYYRITKSLAVGTFPWNISAWQLA